ncbi:outer membrane protein, partial [Methylocystis sp.]|uniref:outer membrane protein n=1 Tax=Methylocystis sp. TaxID=1911079 RepID=UPI003D144127
GQRFDTVGVAPLLEGVAFGALIADKAFDNNAIIADLDARGAKAYGGVYANANHSAGGNLGLSIFNTNLLTTGAPVVPGTGRYSNTRVGWSAGGGFEWMVMPNWSVKAEAIYYDLGSATFSSSPVIAVSPLGIGNFGGPFIANVPTTRVNYNGVIARVGINYHFNWFAPPAPVYAKY